jgi:hypothetical protein
MCVFVCMCVRLFLDVCMCARACTHACNVCMYIRGPFERFVDWRQCAAVMLREAVTIMPSCSGGGNVVVV